MDYGSIIYSTASQSTLNQLNTIQNTAIRIETGALRTSPISSLHVEANIMPLNHHRNLDILTYYFRVHKNPHNVNAYRLTSEAAQFSNFRQYSQKLLQQYILCEQDGQQHICKTDLVPAVTASWQREWTESSPTLLHIIKPTLGEWATSYHEDRKTEKILACVRIGHMILTHEFLCSQNPLPSARPVPLGWT